VELRLRRPRGQAAELAQELKAKAPKEVHVALIQSVHIPTPNMLMQAAAQSRASAKLACERRPLHIGLSIGHVDGGAGSLGAFVQAMKSCERFPRGGDAILSACHVLALQPDGAFGRNLPVYQPGRQDIDALGGQHHIATMFTHYTTFSRIGSNYADAAYAMLEHADKGFEERSNVIPRRLGFPVAGSIAEVMDYDGGRSSRRSLELRSVSCSCCGR
jgi:hypothetical protein